MINNWKQLVASGKVPQGVSAFTAHPDYHYVNHPQKVAYPGDWGYWYTGEQECPECYYRTDQNDVMGTHTCPHLVDNSGTELHVGDLVYAYCHGRIRRARLTKFKKSTGNYTVEDLVQDKRSAINDKSKILKASEYEQEGFRQTVDASIR